MLNKIRGLEADCCRSLSHDGRRRNKSYTGLPKPENHVTGTTLENFCWLAVVVLGRIVSVNATTISGTYQTISPRDYLHCKRRCH